MSWLSGWFGGGDKPAAPRRAIDEAMTDGRGMLLPHVRTFGGMWNTFSRIYSGRWDEAMRHGQRNAEAMRRDAYFRALMQERISPLSRWKWEIEADADSTNPKDPYSNDREHVRRQLEAILKQTNKLHQLRNYLGEAVWYGRYGSQLRWDRRTLGGMTRYVVGWHDPVEGDKIHFSFDGIPGVMIRSGWMPDGYTVRTFDGFGPVLLLDRLDIRERFIVHQHLIEDASFNDPQGAGRRFGVGLRDFVYWSWWLRDELLSWLIDFMQKVGSLGIMVFYHDGSPAGKASAEKAAREVSNSNALAVYRPPGGDKQSAGAELLPANVTGAGFLKDVVGQYFEGHLERLFVGQTLSSGTEGAGLGGTGVAELHLDTKTNLLKFDAENQAATLTDDLVAPALRLNFPDASRWLMRWKYRIPDPAAREKLEAVVKGVSLGLTFKASEVRELIGMTKPDADDEIIGDKPDQPAVGNEGPQQPDEPESTLPFASTTSLTQYHLPTWDEIVLYGKEGRVAVKRQVTRGGKTFEQVFWVKSDQLREGEQPLKGQGKQPMRRAGNASEQEKARTALASFFTDPAAFTPSDIGTATKAMGKLTKSQLQDLARQLRAKISGTKAEVVDRLKEKIRESIEAAPRWKPPSAPDFKPMPVPSEKAPETVKQAMTHPEVQLVYNVLRSMQDRDAQRKAEIQSRSQEFSRLQNVASQTHDVATRMKYEKQSSQVLAGMYKLQEKQPADAKAKFQEMMNGRGTEAKINALRAETAGGKRATPEAEQAMQEAANWFNSVATGWGRPNVTFEPAALFLGKRAYASFSPGSGTSVWAVAMDDEFYRGENLDRGKSTLVHEIAHHLEQNAEVNKACLEFLKYRVGDEEPAQLSKLFPDSEYKENEFGRKDNFDSVFGERGGYYVGKTYSDQATEILSMGVQKLYDDPAKFASADPEYFAFVVGVLKGVIR